MKHNFNNSLIFMFVIIFLESLIYVGFYLPGQLIAVILVSQNSQRLSGIVLLTIISFLAVTLSALINYGVGRLLDDKYSKFDTITSTSNDLNNYSNIKSNIDYKRLLLSMIHINTLALFMFEQGFQKKVFLLFF